MISRWSINTSSSVEPIPWDNIEQIKGEEEVTVTHNWFGITFTVNPIQNKSNNTTLYKITNVAWDESNIYYKLMKQSPNNRLQPEETYEKIKNELERGNWTEHRFNEWLKNRFAESIYLRERPSNHSEDYDKTVFTRQTMQSIDEMEYHFSVEGAASNEILAQLKKSGSSSQVATQLMLQKYKHIILSYIIDFAKTLNLKPQHFLDASLMYSNTQATKKNPENSSVYYKPKWSIHYTDFKKNNCEIPWEPKNSIPKSTSSLTNNVFGINFQVIPETDFRTGETTYKILNFNFDESNIYYQLMKNCTDIALCPDKIYKIIENKLTQHRWNNLELEYLRESIVRYNPPKKEKTTLRESPYKKHPSNNEDALETTTTLMALIDLMESSLDYNLPLKARTFGERLFLIKSDIKDSKSGKKEAKSPVPDIALDFFNKKYKQIIEKYGANIICDLAKRLGIPSNYLLVAATSLSKTSDLTQANNLINDATLGEHQNVQPTLTDS